MGDLCAPLGTTQANWSFLFAMTPKCWPAPELGAAGCFAKSEKGRLWQGQTRSWQCGPLDKSVRDQSRTNSHSEAPRHPARQRHNFRMDRTRSACFVHAKLHKRLGRTPGAERLPRACRTAAKNPDSYCQIIAKIDANTAASTISDVLYRHR